MRSYHAQPNGVEYIKIFVNVFSTGLNASNSMSIYYSLLINKLYQNDPLMN